VFRLEPQRTAYDLNFQIAGVPIRVHPFFWLATIVLGSAGLSSGNEEPNAGMVLLIWVFVVLVSIVVHEMGHALVMRFFGETAHVVLYMLGGLAISGPSEGFSLGGGGRRTNYTQIAISLAGPAAGFLLAGFVIALIYALGGSFSVHGEDFPFYRLTVPPDLSDPLIVMIGDALWVNIFWGLVNLLPVFPLDGGQTARAIFEINHPSNGFMQSLQLSIATGIVMALVGLFIMEDTFVALMFGSLAASNYMTLQQLRGGGRGGFGGRPW